MSLQLFFLIFFSVILITTLQLQNKAIYSKQALKEQERKYFDKKHKQQLKSDGEKKGPGIARLQAGVSLRVV